MHSLNLFCFSLLVSLFVPLSGFSQQFVPTFNCIGIYWSPISGSTTNECQVRYREMSGSRWKSAMPLWFDDRNKQYRGSIMNLTAGETYQIELNLQEGDPGVTKTVSTWSEDFPIGEVVYLEDLSNETLIIDKSGSPQGYMLYTSKPKSKSIIDIPKDQDYGIIIAKNTSYVIIRDVTIKGPLVHGILIGENSTDIVIEGNDVSNWGSANEEGWAIKNHSAVYAKSPEVKRIIIQRNKFHHPRFDANSWDELRPDRQTYHPGGALAVCFLHTFGNHVIRYNEIYSDDDHYFSDGLGGGANYSFEGFPNKDSDIYGNIITHCWDDAIESEGGNQNVRIWGNYIDKTYVKIAIAATSLGPLYIYRNVANTSRRNSLDTDSDLYGRGPFIKAGGRTRNQGVWYGSGRTYIFHNTTLQPFGENKRYTLGGSAAILSSGGELFNTISRNNIFLNYKPAGSVIIDKTNSCTNDFDYDLFNGKIKNNCPDKPHQQNGIRLIRDELPEFRTLSADKQYFLQRNSPGFDQGVLIPNINDGYQGSAPDIGAYEYGWSPLEFGTNAYLESN